MRDVVVDGIVDEARGIQYLGKAVQQPNGRWHALAIVCGSLCAVEVKITLPEGFGDADPANLDVNVW